MKTVIYILCFTLSLSIIGLSQENKSINPEFYKTWLRYEFYSDIMQGKTPRESMKMQPVMQLVFSQNKSTVLITSFTEGLNREYKVISPDTIKVYAALNNGKLDYTISLLRGGNETKLLVDNGKEKMTFRGLDKKYYYGSKGVEHFINDKLIAGKYILAEDPASEVTFSFDGKITGLKDFSEYTIPIFGIGLPTDFDTIVLTSKVNGKRKSEVFHWERSNNNIILYNISKSSENEMDGSKYSNSKILDKYLELRKIK